MMSIITFINIGRMIWSEKYQTEPNFFFLKVEHLLDDFLTFFKMDQSFIKDPLHQTDSLVESHHLLQTFYYHSNCQLKIDNNVK